MSQIIDLRRGIKVFKGQMDSLSKDDPMRLHLKGVVKAFHTTIKGIELIGTEGTLEEIAVKLLPQAELRAELLSQEGYTDEETFHMGEVWGYDEVINYLSPFSSDMQRAFASEEETLTKKEMKMVMVYPLLIGFIGGVLANVCSNYLTVHYLKQKGHL